MPAYLIGDVLFALSHAHLVFGNESVTVAISRMEDVFSIAGVDGSSLKLL